MHRTFLVACLVACGCADERTTDPFAPNLPDASGVMPDAPDEDGTSGGSEEEGEGGEESGSTTDPADPTSDPTDDPDRPAGFCDSQDIWTAAFDGQAVPPAEDTYVCKGFTLEAGQLMHMIAFRANVDNAAFVHHMILYRVATPFPEAGAGCFHGPDWTFQYGWAPGVEDFILPEEAGFLVGNGAGGQTHFVLEVHYNNPLQTSGEIDSTGVDVCMTDTLRPNNASMLALGKVPGISIPPGEPAWEETGVCPSSVTQAALSAPLTVFGSFLHAHLLARQIRTEQYRGGSLVGDLGRDDNYDFNDQKIEMIEGEIQPGDELRTTCVYDSTGQTATTHGGEGTEDEMCLNFLAYYPALPVPACLTDF